MNLLKEVGNLFGGISSDAMDGETLNDDLDMEIDDSNVIEIDVRSHKKGGENINKVFDLMDERHEANRAPLVEARNELQIEIAREDRTIAEAEEFNIEAADESLSRDELTEKLLALETKARIAKQIRAKKERELTSVTAELDQLDHAHQRAHSYLMDVCTNVANARRAGVVMLSQDGMHELRLNQSRAVSELKMIARCGELLMTNSEDPEVAAKALDEICAITIKPDARHLYWDVLSPRTKQDNPELNPYGDSKDDE